MLYSVSSRRTTVRMQRQASTRGPQKSQRNLFGSNDDGLPRPTSANSARPNTANSFQANRPSTPYKNLSDGAQRSRIKIIQDVFFLEDRDLQQFFRSFCFIAKKGDFAPPSKALLTAPKQRERQKNQVHSTNKSNPAFEKVPLVAPERPWEEKAAAGYTLSISEFFATFELSHTSNGGFLDGIFDLVGTKDLHAMTYGEFLDGVCTFGMFKLDDMIKFIFFILDKEKEGRIARFQLIRFVESIHGKKIRAFELAILPSDDTPSSSSSRSNKHPNKLRLPAAERQRASVDYLALKRLCVDYPSMMEPLFLLQTDIRRRIIGEVWWRRKEKQIDKHFSTLDQSREKKRRREEKRLLKERKEKIISEIGFASYYFRRKSRGEAEKEYPKPIVTLEEESGEICVEWTRTDGNGDDSVQTD